jgi:hypothetical protein
MKSRHIVALCVAFGFAQQAPASEPAAPNAQSLGVIEAILNHCAVLDPAHAAQYRDQVRPATQGASDKSVREVRGSEEYKRAYESTTESLATAAGPDAVKTCMASLPPSP